MRFSLPALIFLCCGCPTIAAGSRDSRAQEPATIGTIELPGGVEGIRRALGDRAAIDPAFVGVEIARRLYGGADEQGRGNVLLPRLIDWLDGCARTLTPNKGPQPCRDPSLRSARVPIPGTPEFWRESVFGDRTSDEALFIRILANQRAILLYTALLSMDEATRRWMLSAPALVKRLSDEQVGALAVAAPYLRTTNGTWMLPGGEEARTVWLAVVGSPSAEATSFLPAFLSADRGLLSYLAELCATLTPEQRALAFGLDRPTPPDRVAAARRLMNATRVALASWRPGERPFWRPSPDPALLLAQVAVTNGRLRLPGGRRFWEAALTDGTHDVPDELARALWRDAEPVEPAWLIERVFSGPQALQIRGYEQVLLGARMFAGAEEDAAPDILVVLRAYTRFPELLRTLERMGVSDPELMANIVRHANALPRATDGWRARAAIVQWQSALMLLLRTVERGTTSTEALHRALEELSGGGPSPLGPNPAIQSPSHPATLPWLATWLGRTTSDADPTAETMGLALTDRLAASAVAAGRRITWEDVHYEIDFTAAERSRLNRVRGPAAKRWLDGALAALDLASTLMDARDDRSSPPVPRRLEAIAVGLPRTSAGEFADAARRAFASVRRYVAERGPRNLNDAREALHDLAEALGALALQEIAYAASMGWAEGLPLRADGAAARHRLTIDASAGQSDDLSWTSPRITTGEGTEWHVRGSVLGLDLALAPVTLRRLSMKPPSALPTLSDGNRQLLTTTVVLLDRRRFTDAAQREVAEAIARGRARVAGATGPEDVVSLASEAGISPLRVGLARWSAHVNREARGSLFSLTELIRLGLRGRPFPEILSGWGNRETPLSGRQAAGPLPALFWERYAGRWSHGMLAYAVPDLQLALASQLADMQLPAVLVPDLMAIAVQDFIHSVPARHPDDWHAMASWVEGLTRETTERYLGRLTTDGPLRVERSP